MPDTPRSKSAPSILSHDMHVVGKIYSTGDIQIEGQLDGDLRSHAVTVGEKAEINGEVAGDTVTVFGTVKGTIRGRQIYLCATCKVDGVRCAIERRRETGKRPAEKRRHQRYYS